MIKIAVYVNSLAKGGAERVAVNLTSYFHQSGNEVILVTSRVLPDEYEKPEGVRRIISQKEPEGEIKNRFKYFRDRFRGIRKIWREEKPDYIVAFIGKVNIMALLTSWGMGIPVFVSVRSDPNKEYNTKALRLLSKTLFYKARGIVVQTQDAKAYFPALMQRKVVILPNSLNPRFMKPRWEGKRRNEIVSVGRLDPNKNQQMLIRAFHAVADDYPELQLMLYGEGLPENTTRPKLEELTKQLGLTDRVHFMGRCNDIEERIYAARIFVLTSGIEGMPNALLEAMSLGLACISTDCPCGGPRTVIKDGENGLLIPVGDTGALERSLRRILEDAALEERLGCGAAKLQEQLAPDKVNRMWMDYMESRLRKKKAYADTV